MSLSHGSNSTENLASTYRVNPEPIDARSPTDGLFIERRRSANHGPTLSERRQFGSSHTGLSEPGRELAIAIDRYKMEHHRRYLTCDEILSVIAQLGYTRR